MSTRQALLALVVVLFPVAAAACGNQAPAASPATEGATTAAPAAAPAAASASAAASAAPAPGAPAAGGLTAKKLSDAYEAGFFEDAMKGLTDRVGAPTAAKKGTIRTWYYNKQGTGKSAHCDTLDLVELPNGKSVLGRSAVTSPDLEKVKVTTTQVETALKAIESQAFTVVDAQLQRALGKPVEEAKLDVATWKYTADEGCKLFVVYEAIGSRGSMNVEDGPCE
jgi:hypothetical protein